MPFATHLDGQIEYFVEGSGPPLLLVHGSGEDAHGLWYHHGYVHALSEHFTTIAVNCRGYGQSSGVTKLEHLAYSLYRDDCLAVMDAVGAEQFMLLGYSRGGMIGSLLAIEYPERVTGLVVGGANLGPGSHFSSGLGRKPRPRFHPRRVASAIKRRIRARMNPRFDGQLAYESPWRPMLEQHGMSMHDGWQRYVKPLADIERAVERLTMPVLFFQGEHDELFDLDQSRVLTSRLPEAELRVIPGADHGVIHHPDLVLPLVERFLLQTAGLAPHDQSAIAGGSDAT